MTSEQLENSLPEESDKLGTVHVGQVLRAAREARGLSQSEAAQLLKLGVRQIDAIEQAAWDALPGLTIVRGFVRNYAKLLGVDPQPLMLELDRSLVRTESRLSLPQAQPADMRSPGKGISARDRLMLIAAFSFLLVAVTVYSLFGSDLSDLRQSVQQVIDHAARKEEPVLPPTDPVMPPGASTADVLNPQALPSVTEPAGPSVSAAVEPQATKLTTAPGEVSTANDKAPQIKFIIDKDSWVEVRDRSNKVLLSQKHLAGSEQTLSGQGPLSLVIGYAPGVRIYWHGQLVDLAPHTKGDVARLVLE